MTLYECTYDVSMVEHWEACQSLKKRSTLIDILRTTSPLSYPKPTPFVWALTSEDSQQQWWVNSPLQDKSSS